MLLLKVNILNPGILSVYMDIAILGGIPVPTAWSVLGLRMEERPPDMEVSCEYIETAVADRKQGVVLQLWGWAWG
jgi:hypothetical protein